MRKIQRACDEFDSLSPWEPASERLSTNRSYISAQANNFS